MRKYCIDAVTLQSTMADDTVVIDCRFTLGDPDAGPRAYAKGHIPGAVYGDNERDFASPVVAGVTGRHPLPNPDTLASQLAAWGVTEQTRIICYDDITGPFATRAWWCLYWLGLRNIFVLDGGLRAWQAAGFAITTQTAPLHDATPTFRYAADDQLLVNAAFITNNNTTRLLDARAAERFRGEIEPIDAVAGHIPGAQCVPFQSLVDANSGQLLPVAQLRAILAQALDGRNADDAVCYCGSGITATLLIFACVNAGLGMPRLYAGSWSEWICDRRRPIATGA